MRLGKQFLFLSGIFFLSSCSQGWIEVYPDKYVSKTSGATYESKKPLPPLSDLLKPVELPDENEEMSLASLVDIALKNQPKTQETWAKAKQAAANWGIARAGYYPAIYFTSNASQVYKSLGSSNNAQISPTSANLGIGVQKSWGYQGTLVYTVFDFGKRLAKSKSAMQALEMANWTHNQEIQTTLQKVSNTYYSYLYEKANLEALETDLKDAHVSFQAATQKLETGVADISEMLQAKSKYLQQKLKVTEQIATVENQYYQLLNDLGIPSDAKITLSKLPEEVNLSEFKIDPTELVAVAKINRPDISSAKAKVLKMKSDIDSARLEQYPTISSNFSMGKNYYDGSGNAANYSLQLSMSFPFFAGFYFTNQIKKAEDALLEAKANLRSLENQLTQDVMKYIANFESSKKSVSLSKEYLDSALKEFNSVLSNYEMGTNSILEVVSSQSSLADARAQYIKTKKDLFVALTDLTYAVGTLSREDYEDQTFTQKETK